MFAVTITITRSTLLAEETFTSHPPEFFSFLLLFGSQNRKKLLLGFCLLNHYLGFQVSMFEL